MIDTTEYPDESRFRFAQMSFAEENRQEPNHQIPFSSRLPVFGLRAIRDSLWHPSSMDCGSALQLTL